MDKIWNLFPSLSPLSASSVTITWRHWAMRHSPRRLGRVVRRETGRGPGYGDTEATLDSSLPLPAETRTRRIMQRDARLLYRGRGKYFMHQNKHELHFWLRQSWHKLCVVRNWHYETRTRDGWRSPRTATSDIQEKWKNLDDEEK